MKPELDWDSYFLSMLDIVRKRSSDAQTQVATIFVENKRIISTGYNAFPSGIDDLPDIRPDKYKWCVHGEINAIDNCLIKPENPTCYITGTPCERCNKAMWNFKVRRIVSLNRLWTSCFDDDYEVLAKLIAYGLEFKVQEEPERPDEAWTILPEQFSYNLKYNEENRQKSIKHIKGLLQ